MAIVRENILMNAGVRDAFLDGVVALDTEFNGVRASDLLSFVQRNNIPLDMAGIQQDISTYDLFVFWHVAAMAISTPPGNAAHMGPIFLPWHRMFLFRFEEQLQRVLGDPDFALPYWDWSTDGELPRIEQWQTPLWTADYLGEPRGRVRTGPMGNVRVRLVEDAQTGVLWSIEPDDIIRAAGQDQSDNDLPNQAEEQIARDQTVYDQPDWGLFIDGHRNRLEGWWANGPQLHNRVHVWIGGDMTLGSSPNDPAFFLNHCNVDRIWEEWMANHGRQYQPGPGTGPAGHRLDSTMFSILSDNLTPADVLDPTPVYSYDTMPTS